MHELFSDPEQSSASALANSGISASSEPAVPIASQAATDTTGHAVILSGLWNSFSQATPLLLTLVVSVAAARYLGPSGMGRQSFIAFAMISLTQLISEGLKESLMRSIGEARGADRPGAIRGLVRWALRIQLAGALAGAAVLALAALLGAPPQAAWVFASLTCLMLTLQGVPWAVLTGSQQWRRASTVGLVTGVVTAPATILVLALGGGITGMFAVAAVGACWSLAWTTVLARRSFGTLPKAAEPFPDLQARTVRYAQLATLMTLATFVVWQRSEFLFLNAYSNNRQIAFYSIPFAAMGAISLIPASLAGVLSPAFATLHGAREHGRVRSGYWRAQRLLLIVSIPLMAGFAALGPALIRLIYGGDYRPAGPVLLILLSVLPLIPLLAVTNALLVGMGLLRVALAWEVVGGAATIGLNFLLVPSHAAIGAAIADVGGQFTAVLPILIYANRIAGPVALDLPAIGRLIVSGALAGGVAWAGVTLVGGAGGLLLGVVLGLLVFAALAVLLRVVPYGDREWVSEIIARRLGAPAGHLASVLVAAPPPGSEG